MVIQLQNLENYVITKDSQLPILLGNCWILAKYLVDAIQLMGFDQHDSYIDSKESLYLHLLRQADLMNQISESHGKIFLRSQAKSHDRR